MPTRSYELADNCLLRAFSEQCREYLAARMLTKPVASGEILLEPGSPVHSLIFPLEGVVSLQFAAADTPFREMLAVGSNGMVGSHVLLGEKRSPERAVVVVSGVASWLSLSDLREVEGRFSCVGPVFQSYLASVMAGLMCNIACASTHTARQRVSAWLIRAQDIARTRRLDVTQQTLGGIMGLRQATVSQVCAMLHDKGAIIQSRGAISLADRKTLEREACQCWRGAATGYRSVSH